MVETDLGEHGEVAGDPGPLRCHLGDPDVRHVVADDAPHSRIPGDRSGRGDRAAEELDDGVTALYGHTAAKLELAVLAERFGEVLQSHRVA